MDAMSRNRRQWRAYRVDRPFFIFVAPSLKSVLKSAAATRSKQPWFWYFVFEVGRPSGNEDETVAGSYPDNRPRGACCVRDFHDRRHIGYFRILALDPDGSLRRRLEPARNGLRRIRRFLPIEQQPSIACVGMLRVHAPGAGSDPNRFTGQLSTRRNEYSRHEFVWATIETAANFRVM